MTKQSDGGAAFPAPWSLAIEPTGYPESDDQDLHAVIRDSNGEEVLTVHERYGAQMAPLHVILAAMITRAINCGGADSLLSARMGGEHG